MKKTILLFSVLLGLLLTSEKQFAQTIWSLDFETAGGYTTSVPEFTDGSSDYFIRTDGTDHGSWVVYNGVVGTYYFAGMDLDGEGAILPLFLDINDIDITGQTTLQFRVYLAEDDDGTNQDWDDADYVHFGYDIDNTGSFTPMLWVEGAGGTNAAPHIDTNFDGIGDGTEITDDFIQFFVPLSVSGSLMDIQIEFDLDSGDEDLAIDHMELVIGGGPLPLDANFSADQTTILTGSTVNFTDLTSGGTLPYSYEWDLDGDGAFDDAFIANPSFMYNTPGSYDVSLRVTDDDTSVDTETKIGYITVITPIEVANLAALRAGTIGEVYQVTGEVSLTYQMSFRNQKYIQDATAGILIDDDPGIITTTFNLYEGMTGLVGTLGVYNNMTQFVPFTDPGAPTTGYTITPQIVTIDDLIDAFDDYESELVKILDVSFTDAGASFANGTVYPISDLSKALGEFRTTFYDENYIGTEIPASADIVVLPNARDIGNYVTCRTIADFTIESNDPTQLSIVSVNGGANPYVNTDFNVVVQALDINGDPAIVTSDVNFTFKTDGGNLGTVSFVGGTTTTGTIVNGTSQVTVTGVQMAPTGTNVTITAEDDLTFGGLSPGISAPFDVVELIVPDLIICEIMPDPVDVGDADGEWFEIYNNGTSAIDLLGYVIKDNDFDSTTIDLSVIVPAGGFVVLGRNSDPLLNGDYTCDYQYSGFSLGNTADEVILTLPDGLTELDRVEYDGGTIWPDPTATSMTFHGFPTDDNNDGTNWTYATFREASYSAIGEDRGSPGTNGYDQILTGGFKMDLKVFLEGPYDVDSDIMLNILSIEDIVPPEQPFNPTLPYYGNNSPVWLYGGTEITTYFPFDGIDWVLVEIRDAASAGSASGGTMIAQYPAYLMADGTVVSLNGATPLNMDFTYSNNLYVVIWHRNHLGIMSATGLNPIDGTIESYDFSNGSGQVYNGAIDGYKLLETGVWGMVAGDVDAEGNVDGSDKADGWALEAGEAGYLGGDLNLDGQSSNQDKNDVWLLNNGASSQVPN